MLDRRGPFTTALVQVFRATKAGALYANIVFLIGFILGTIRVLLLAPRLGQTTAVILEAPTILAASWFVSRWCVDRLDVAATVPAGSLMGLVTFLVLMSGDFGLGAVLGRSLVDRVAAYGSLAGTIGLGAQVIFPSRPSPPITPPARSAHTRGKPRLLDMGNANSRETLTRRWREMDSNHRFRATTSFVSRPRRPSPVAMIPG